MILDGTITDLAKRLRSKKISSVELVSSCYDQINAFDTKLHAGITIVDKDEAVKAAKEIDDNIFSHSSPLAGIPFVMKDAYVTEGVRTTAGSKILDTFIPPYSATVYKKLLDAGAILLGKMNMDAWGHGGTTENTDYGVCKNPWDLSRSAGGSGGGPAAAIASRFCSFGIGEDTGGSIRNPAAWNNISAMKVTYGRVSRYGAIAYASSLDTVGPTAKTAEDCAHVLEMIAGNDPFDATSSPSPVPSYTTGLDKSIRGKKIAFPVEFYGDALNPEIKKAIVLARDVFTSLGATVEEISMPMLEYGVSVYYILAPSETSSNLGRYDAVRYGAARDLFTKETMRRIMVGTYALSAGYYDAYYKKAQRVRSLFIQNYRNVFAKYDAILSPVSAILPPKFGELLNDPIKNMVADLYTVPVNIVGVPSLSVPCGFSAKGLPIGMQLIGNMFTEDTLLNLGHAYQKQTDWHLQKPAALKTVFVQRQSS